MKHLLFASVVVLVPAVASPPPVYVKNGFLTGEQYLQMAKAEREAFAMGLVNGMLLAPLLGAPKKRLLKLETCLEKMTNTQVEAILTKYLRDNPARWHETPHVPMYSALIESCPIVE